MVTRRVTRTLPAQARSRSKAAILMTLLHTEGNMQVKEIATALHVFPSAVSRVLHSGRGGDTWVPALITMAKARGLLGASVATPAADQSAPREPDSEPQRRCWQCKGQKQPISHFDASGHVSVMRHQQNAEEQSRRDSASEDDHDTFDWGDDEESADEDRGISTPPAPVRTLPAKLAKQDPATLVGLLRHDVPPEHRLRAPIEAKIIQLAEEGRRARQVERLSPPLRARTIASAEQQMAELPASVEQHQRRVEQQRALYEGTHPRDVALPPELATALYPAPPPQQTRLQTLAERARQARAEAAMQDLQAVRAGPRPP